jgi:stalled ribosome rescue protein Dom34
MYAVPRIVFHGTRREHAVMTHQHHILVWLDHRLARVLHFNDESSNTTVVHSKHPHVHLHHKANSIDSGHAALDKEFLGRVVQALPASGPILISGPGTAKTELDKFIREHHPKIAARVSAVESLDHPTDGELLAHGRKFFVADDRMRSQMG